MIPYYDRDGITLYCADNRDVLPLLAPVDLILTDPPYGVDKAEWDGEFQQDWQDEAAKLAPVLGLMPGTVNLTRCPVAIDDLVYRWCLAAHLVNGMTWGPMGASNWIACLVYARQGVRLPAGGDCADFVIGREPKPDHPSPKPYAVTRWFLNRLPGSVVLDPFAGSGTTLRAAKDLGRRAIGIEINPEYCAVAVERLRQQVLPLEVSA